MRPGPLHGRPWAAPHQNEPGQHETTVAPAGHGIRCLSAREPHRKDPLCPLGGVIDERMHLSRSFQYSKGFLQWALLVPSYAPDWHLGVRLASSGKLMAFITAVLLPHIPLCPHTSFAHASGGCASTPSP